MISMFLYKKKNSRQSSAANQLLIIAMSICYNFIPDDCIYNIFRAFQCISRYD